VKRNIKTEILLLHVGKGIRTIRRELLSCLFHSQLSRLRTEIQPCMRRASVFLLLTFSLLAAGVPALAHHSLTAEFDPSRVITVTGVLVKVEWTNPHVYWYVDAKNENGQTETWSFESNPPGTLHRAGIRKEDWKIGETVSVTAAAAKDDTKHLGFGKMIKYSDGHVLVFRVGGE
jgi:hypothetical protein